MGRGKLKMELIEKERARMVTLKKRKEGLMKKLHELTTLCGVSACMIIYDGSASSPSIWPQNSDEEVRRLIDGYNSKKEHLGGVKYYGVSDFLNNRRKEIEGEVEKLRKKNLEAKYPSWDDRLSLMDESQLRGLSAALRNKALSVRSRIQFLKQQESQIMMMMMPFNSDQFNYFYDLDQDAAFGALAPSNFNHYYNFDQEIKASDATTMQQNNFAAQFPMKNMQNCYAPPPPQPYTAYYPVMNVDCFCSSLDQNLNYWG